MLPGSCRQQNRECFKSLLHGEMQYRDSSVCTRYDKEHWARVAGREAGAGAGKRVPTDRVFSVQADCPRTFWDVHHRQVGKLKKYLSDTIEVQLILPETEG